MARSTFASRSYRDDAVVLRTYDLGEADRIVILLTAENGQVRAVAKGVRRTKSRFGARLEPFHVAQVQLVHGRNLDIVSQAIGKRAYGQSIVADYEKYTAAAAMVETAEKLTADDYDTAVQHYQLLVGALSALARGLHEPGRILDSYLLRAVALAGWTPSFVDCARCGAPGPRRCGVSSVPSAGIRRAQCGHVRVAGRAAARGLVHDRRRRHQDRARSCRVRGGVHPMAHGAHGAFSGPRGSRGRLRRGVPATRWEVLGWGRTTPSLLERIPA